MLFRIFPHFPIPIWKSFALPSQVWGGNGRLFAEAHGGTYLHEPTQPDSLQDPKGLHRILTKLLLDQMADGAWQNVKIDKHIPYSSYFKGVEASSSQWNPNCWRPSFGWGHGSKCILSLWRWWDHLPGPLAESWTNGNGADSWIRFPKLDPSGRLSAADCTWHRHKGVFSAATWHHVAAEAAHVVLSLPCEAGGGRLVKSWIVPFLVLCLVVELTG